VRNNGAWETPIGSQLAVEAPPFLSTMNDRRTPTLTPADLGTVLSVWAHPDDETYLSGGVMSMASDNGQRVVCVSATSGEEGGAATDGTDIGAVRRREFADAMALLGVRDHRFLGFVDGALDRLDIAQPVAAIVSLIEDVRPDTILTFGADGTTFHPDHIAVHRWVTTAWSRLGRPARLLYSAWGEEHLVEWMPFYEEWGIFMTDQRPEGIPHDELDLDLLLTDAALDRKVAALRAMASQTKDIIANVGIDMYRAETATERFIAAG
jgi:LmbE family N-acetylglucosaminyl deacetylase